jgi:hypothetical protein
MPLEDDGAMKWTILPLLAVGCGSATMVNSPGRSGSPYAPVNESQRPGVVKYLNQGADVVIRSRREDAYKQMHSSCGGTYRIDAEGPQVDGQTAMMIPGAPGAGSSVVVQNQEYWYIQFSCVGPTPRTATAGSTNAPAPSGSGSQ